MEESAANFGGMKGKTSWGPNAGDFLNKGLDRSSASLPLEAPTKTNGSRFGIISVFKSTLDGYYIIFWQKSAPIQMGVLEAHIGKILSMLLQNKDMRAFTSNTLWEWG